MDFAQFENDPDLDPINTKRLHEREISLANDRSIGEILKQVCIVLLH
jgi:hypothetical protein